MTRSQKSELRLAQSVACAAPNAISARMITPHTAMNSHPPQSRGSLMPAVSRREATEVNGRRG